jgi:hypothetical protein
MKETADREAVLAWGIQWRKKEQGWKEQLECIKLQEQQQQQQNMLAATFIDFM